MMKKRIISLLLAAMMLAGMMSVSAFAADEVVSISVAPYNVDVDEYYAGDEILVAVSINKAGYAGLQVEVELSDNLSFSAVEMNIPGNVQLNPADGSFVWINGKVDEMGSIDVTDGLVNTEYTGVVCYLRYAIADDAEVGDTAAIKVRAKAADAEENYVFENAMVEAHVTVSEKPVPPYTLGDVYIDGRINSRDAALVASYAVGNATLDETQKLAADVTGDGRINSRDASMIASYAVGNITEF